MRDVTLEALTRLELREAELLGWGATGGRWTSDELDVALSEFGEAAALRAELSDAALIVECPDGTFRTRAAETMRILSTLRQAFPTQMVSSGVPLVLDYRYVHRARRRPRRDVEAAALVAQLQESNGASAADVARVLTPDTVSGFQVRSSTTILDALSAGGGRGVIVTAGTGSGKTLGFYLPLLTHLASRSSEGTVALALYPRNELLKDQLRALLQSMDKITTASPARQLSVATWFGDTPQSVYALKQGWASSWTERTSGYVCPYVRCLKCNKDMLWLKADLQAAPARERLTCSDGACGGTIDGDVLRLTRESARRRPADVMLSSTESLNRQLSSPANLGAFGISGGALKVVLLDEVHVYEGASGAQNALLLRRLRHAVGHPLTYVGLSATLRNAGEFFSRLVDLPSAAVATVQPDPTEMEEAGAEYLVALRHDPNSRTGVLSASIQTCMALARCLDGDQDPFDPPPDSGLVVGRRLFVFADKLDSTNRLYWDLLSAEGQAWPGKNLTRSPLTLAHLRSREQSRLAATRRESAAERDEDGQWWWLAEQLGHRVEGDLPLRISRTSSQDRGVAGASQVVVATASLEVGFDDERVGAVVQHKAPHDNAQFLQRKGRAGRLQVTRPWTVVVLGNWGADRRAWDSYDELFDPELAARNLPLENRYVLRIQAVYVLLDWLATQVKDVESWSDLAGPASLLSPRNTNRAQVIRARQQELGEVLSRLLRPGPERERLRRHLRLALSLGSEDVAGPVLDSILWDAPRPLLLAVVPTMRRRLVDQWQGELPLAEDAALRTRTPLREFVPGNLFDELLVPEVEFLVPGRSGKESVEYLPALRALREFSPGNVSRHFGVWATNKRHWVPLPASVEGGVARVDVVAAYGASQVDTLQQNGNLYPLYTPRRVRLDSVPDTVRDASSMQPNWDFTFLPLGTGWSAPLAPRVRRLFRSLTCHLHADGGGARVLRTARTASGTAWDPGARRIKVEFGIGEAEAWSPVALGVDVACDALVGEVAVPDPPADIPPQERSERLLHLIRYSDELPEDISDFDCDTLADLVLLARVRGDRRDGDDLTALRSGLVEAARVLGLVGSEDDDRENDWLDYLEDRSVLEVAGLALREVNSPGRSLDWVEWWRSRYTLSAAQVALSGLSALSPGVDPEDLLVDLLPGRTDTFVLSEASPGGIGQVEAFRLALNEDPGLVTRALADALRPTPIETLDDEVSALIADEDGEVSAALEVLRRSWRQGHEAATQAVRDLDRVLEDRGTLLSGPARKVLSTRLAGPGAHADLLRIVGNWLERRRAARAIGFDVDSRLLGALVAHEPDADEALRLPPDATPTRRARAVSNVLWPWGYAMEGGAVNNSYGTILSTSPAALRAAVDLAPPTLTLTFWDDSQRQSVHQRLLAEGELTLTVLPAARSTLRQAMLDLQIEPVEVGAVLAHPVTVSLWEDATAVKAQLVLREAT